MGKVEIVEANADNIHTFALCGYKNMKQEGYRRKIEWLKQRFKEGLKYKFLYSEQDGAVGGIEYIPGEYAWRPVDAADYMFIHCIYIMSRKYKEQGHGVILVQTCIDDAKKNNMSGVAVVSRKGTWMTGSDLFIKQGFTIVDEALPDFKLLAHMFNNKAPSPKFKVHRPESATQFSQGLTMLSSDQCPYTAKAIKEISDTAETQYGVKINIVDLKSHQEAQNSPCAFGTFCMLYDGKIIADHPISNTRFKNIMNKIVKKNFLEEEE
jgi:N-acetylglutamate synthase-like GNAT family acetyltransferase